MRSPARAGAAPFRRSTTSSDASHCGWLRSSSSRRRRRGCRAIRTPCPSISRAFRIFRPTGTRHRRSTAGSRSSCRQVRAVVTGALEIAAGTKTQIGSSLEAASTCGLNLRRRATCKTLAERRFRGGLHHLGHRDRGGARGPPDAFRLVGRARRRGRRARCAEGTQMRALLEDLAPGRVSDAGLPRCHAAGRRRACGN